VVVVVVVLLLLLCCCVMFCVVSKAFTFISVWKIGTDFVVMVSTSLKETRKFASEQNWSGFRIVYCAPDHPFSQDYDLCWAEGDNSYSGTMKPAITSWHKGDDGKVGFFYRTHAVPNTIDPFSPIWACRDILYKGREEWNPKFF